MRHRRWAEARAHITEACHAIDSDPVSLLEGDEMTITQFYAERTVQLCEIQALPAKVMFTAVVLLQRFFLRHSVTHHDPGVIMFTCVFLATKLEEFHQTKLRKILHDSDMKSISVEQVLQAELVVLEGIEFDVQFPNGLTFISGFCGFVEQALSLDAPTVKQIRQRAADILLLHLPSDLFLLYDICEVAIAAVLLAMREGGADGDAVLLADRVPANRIGRIHEVQQWISQPLKHVDMSRMKEALSRERKVKKVLKKHRKQHRIEQ